MELREFADLILVSDRLEEKLRTVRGGFSDHDPGPAQRVALPGRPRDLQFCQPRQAPPMPHVHSLAEPRRRGVAHHIMANHELQALEVMAFVLRAFPEAPTEFRLGLARVMCDEQRHTRLHAERAAELGVPFGSLPVNGYFWLKAQQFGELLDYLAGLPLTFEGGNLDHTLEFEEAFRRAGDSRGGDIMRAIHLDEIDHVAFGWTWLQRLKPADQSEWEAYVGHLHWPLRPSKSRGRVFHREPRLAAGLSPDFIARLEADELDAQNPAG